MMNNTKLARLEIVVWVSKPSKVEPKPGDWGQAGPEQPQVRVAHRATQGEIFGDVCGVAKAGDR